MRPVSYLKTSDPGSPRIRCSKAQSLVAFAQRRPAIDDADMAGTGDNHLNIVRHRRGSQTGLNQKPTNKPITDGHGAATWRPSISASKAPGGSRSRALACE